jgi:hypothetical protein
MKSHHYEAMHKMGYTDEEIEADWKQVCEDLDLAADEGEKTREIVEVKKPEKIRTWLGLHLVVITRRDYERLKENERRLGIVASQPDPPGIR